MSNQRNQQLDFVKGVLVIEMLLYHVAAYSIDNVELSMRFRQVFLDFVSGSWVFISGLIVVVFYGKRFVTDKKTVLIRLVTRSVKIIILFLVLNFIVWSMQLSKSLTAINSDFFVKMLVVGGGDAAFEILLGIGYALLLGSVILLTGRCGPYLSMAIAIILVSMPYMGYKLTPNQWIIACGVLGMLSGYIVTRVSEFYLGSVRQNQTLLVLALIVLILYYLVRLFFHTGKSDLAIYSVGIIANILLFYSVYPLVSQQFRKSITAILLLGRHSLIAYVGQMAIIWVWAKMMSINAINNVFLIDFVLIASFTFILIKVVDYLIRHYSGFYKLYRVIFQ